MIGNYNNIPFKFAKISNKASTISSSMTDSKFYKSKPIGYYNVFTFEKDLYTGNYYDDLKDLVKFEMNNIWDKSNRTTMLGYNLETNNFIMNLSSYLGLKDSDLKTDGELAHSGQAGWYEMELTDVKADGILSLKQTDGTDIYLKIKPLEKRPEAAVRGSVCVESTKKSVVNSSLFVKNNGLWCKSPEDNSVVMVRDNVLEDYSKSNASYIKPSYVNNKRCIKCTKAYPTDPNHPMSYQSCIYGKPVIYFENASVSATDYTSVFSFLSNYNIKNNTGVDHVEYTETSDLNDILQSGESLNFMAEYSQKFPWGLEYNGTSRSYNKPISVFPPVERGFFNFKRLNNIDYRTESVHVVNPVILQFISLDPKDKPFLFTFPNSNFKLSKIITNYPSLGIPNNIDTLPEGFIFTIIGKDASNSILYRFKKGEPAKKKVITTINYPKLSITGATKFGDDLYGSTTHVVIADAVITKDDLVNGTGFVDLTDDEIEKSILATPEGGILFNVYKI